MCFLTKAHFKVLRSPLLFWRWNESVGGLSDFESRLAPHVKWCKIQIGILFTVNLVKFDLLQMIPNLGILYTVRNDFSPWLTIQDCYLEIRPCLAQIICKFLTVCLEKLDSESGHFRYKPKAPSWREWHRELNDTKKEQWKWPENGVSPSFLSDLPRALHPCQQWWFCSWRNALNLFSEPPELSFPVRVWPLSSSGLDQLEPPWKLEEEMATKMAKRKMKERKKEN